jgi:DNA replication protein DnaC
MTNERNCLLSGSCKFAGDPKACTGLCPYFVMMHGQSGYGGRVRQANIPKDYSKMTVKNNPVRESQPQVFKQIDGYVRKSFPRMFQPDGERIRSLYLYSSSPGTGKTSTACSIANTYLVYYFIGAMKHGHPIEDNVVYFLDFNHFQSKFNQFNNPNVPKEFKDPASHEFYTAQKAAMEAQLLVIDDIGIRDPSEAFGSIAHDLINHRTVNRMPTIYTSNVPMVQLINKYDERLWDRIKDNCIQIDFAGESHRGIRKDFDA